MVAQDHCFGAAERNTDSLATCNRHHINFVIIEDLVVVVERTRLLRDRTQLGDQRRERGSVWRVRMRSRDNVGARGVQWRVNVKCRWVDRAMSLHHLAGGAHEYEIVNRHLIERHPETTEPEMISEFRVSSRDVAVAKVSPSQCSKHPIAQCEAGLAMRTQRGGVVNRQLVRR